MKNVCKIVIEANNKGVETYVTNYKVTKETDKTLFLELEDDVIGASLNTKQLKTVLNGVKDVYVSTSYISLSTWCDAKDLNKTKHQLYDVCKERVSLMKNDILLLHKNLK